MSALEEYSVANELNRKTLVTLEWLTNGINSGRITLEQFSFGIDTLFMTVSGLVDKDFITIISEGVRMSELVQSLVKKVFLDEKSRSVMTFSWTPGADSVLTCMRSAAGVTRRSIDMADALAASTYMNGISELMSKKGWIEL